MTELVEAQGIKETKELIIGVLEIGVLMIERFGDGVNLGDLLAIMNKLVFDKDFKGKISNAFDGVDKVQLEIKDLSKEEIAELVVMLLPELMSILTKLKK